MSLEETLEAFYEGLAQVIDADRQNSQKWQPIYNWFTDHIGAPMGSARGKLLTDLRQVNNRRDELLAKDPKYVVFTVVDDAIEEERVLQMLASFDPRIQRVVLLTQNLNVTRLIVFQHDSVTAALGELFKGVPVEDRSKGHTPAPNSDSLAGLADELHVSLTWLTSVRDLLEDRKQIIFYGPPGTGKTYVAQRLARFLAGADDCAPLVQFHGTYAYEDFIEGYRPRLVGGVLSYEIEKGPLRLVAADALKNPDKTYVMVIDEINRANLSKVLGELYFLLEYRKEQTPLLYSRETFQLPENLLFIGTMNAADRSIAFVDSALRRRFHFVPFFPDQVPVLGLLRRWLDDKRADMIWVADLVEAANSQLRDRHGHIGPSYFLREDLNEVLVAQIWQYSVLPYIEEQLFGQENRLSDFDLEYLRTLPPPATS